MREENEEGTRQLLIQSRYTEVMGITLMVRSLEGMKRYGEGAAWNTLEDLLQRDPYVKECHAEMMTLDPYTAIQADMKRDVAANIRGFIFDAAFS